jgi:Cu-Zn family superoxide dismutase
MGRVEFDFVDSLVQLSGPHSVIGRGIILHQKQDDLGLPGRKALNEEHDDLSKYERESLMTGNAGGRIACGIIAYA